MIYIAVAGMLGALARYALSLMWNPAEIGDFPWGTLACNWGGSLLLSCIGFASLSRLAPRVRLAVTTGFIGSFTTFSTFAYETMRLMSSGYGSLALVYVLLSVWGGLLCAWLGARLAQWTGTRRGRSA